MNGETTAHAGVTTNLDIQELVGELPAKSCEHRFHRLQPSFHSEDNLQYVRRQCASGCYDHVLIYCGKIVEMLVQQINTVGVCRRCGRPALFGETFTVLGPVENGAGK